MGILIKFGKPDPGHGPDGLSTAMIGVLDRSSCKISESKTPKPFNITFSGISENSDNVSIVTLEGGINGTPRKPK